jgi:hypothetical protein
MVVVFLRAPLMPMLMAHFSAPNGKGATGGRALLQKFTLYIQYDILRGEIGHGFEKCLLFVLSELA